MSPRTARFLTSLYPPAWRERFGAEFQTFLEARDVSLLEAISIAREALIEHVTEGWRTALLGMAFVGIPLFAGCCALYLGAGRPLAPAGLWIAWGSLVAAAVAACVALLESPWVAVRGALGSGRLIGHAAFTVLASAVLLCFPSHGHNAAGLAMMWVASLWHEAARRLPVQPLPLLLAASTVSATLDCAGWGVFYRGDFVVDLWFFAALSLFEVVKTAKSARRIFVGQ